MKTTPQAVEDLQAEFESLLARCNRAGDQSRRLGDEYQAALEHFVAASLNYDEVHRRLALAAAENGETPEQMIKRGIYPGLAYWAYHKERPRDRDQDWRKTPPPVELPDQIPTPSAKSPKPTGLNGKA